MTIEQLKALPKAELHCHLDGSLSREFMESRLGRRVQQEELSVSDDCTSLIISHRLSIGLLADKILYLENGRLVEQGSHDELMKQGGRYAEMFKLQAEKYT